MTEIRQHLRAAVFILLSCFAVFAESALAQEYVEIIGGSPYWCVLLPNGKNKIAIKKGQKFDIESYPDAQSALVKQRAGLTTRVHDLNNLLAKFKEEHIFHTNMLQQLTHYLHDFNTDAHANVKMPPKDDGKKGLIIFLTSQAQLGVKNRNSALASLLNCKNNKRPSISTIQSKVVTIRNTLNQVVGVRLMLLIPTSLHYAPNTGVDYCVLPKDGKAGTSLDQYFTPDPCLRDPLIGISCAALVPAKHLADFYGGGVTWSTPPNDEELAAGLTLVNQAALKDYLGLFGSNCSVF